MNLQGTVDDWRRDMLEVLERNERDLPGSRVQWVTAGDRHVCARCAARDGSQLTYPEARQELTGEFCRPGDPDDRCRCTFVAAVGPR